MHSLRCFQQIRCGCYQAGIVGSCYSSNSGTIERCWTIVHSVIIRSIVLKRHSRFPRSWRKHVGCRIHFNAPSVRCERLRALQGMLMRLAASCGLERKSRLSCTSCTKKRGTPIQARAPCKRPQRRLLKSPVPLPQRFDAAQPWPHQTAHSAASHSG